MIEQKITKKEQIRVNGAIACLLIVCIIRIFLFDFWDSKFHFLSLILSCVSAFFVLCAVLFVYKHIKFSVKVIWLFMLVMCAASFGINKSGFEYMCNTVMVLGLLFVLPYVKINRKFVLGLIAIYSIYCLMLILFAPRDGDISFANISVNPNTSSYAMFYLFSIMMVVASKQKRKIVPLIVAGIAVIFQIVFSGRSALIGTALFIIYIVFKKQFNHLSHCTVYLIQIVLCVFGIAFAYIYAFPLYAAWGYGKFRIFGKDIFTGRQAIWRMAFSQLNNNLLFGIGNTLAIDANEGIVNLHNQMLGFLTCFGLGATIAIILLLSFVIDRLYNRNRSNYATAIMTILLIMSYFETTIYSSVHIVLWAVVVSLIYVFEKGNIYKGRRNDYSLLLARKVGKIGKNQILYAKLETDVPDGGNKRVE